MPACEHFPLTMIKAFLVCLLFPLCPHAYAQHYTSANIFAHNDYVRPKPFHTAYDLGVGYIEADVFLQDGQLLVAHHRHEISKEKDIESLYLRPLLLELRKNRGSAYKDPQQELTLMVDIKSEGPATLKALVQLLEKYPALLSCATLDFMISGNVPDPATWDLYPAYITFDGRPGIPYSSRQLERISMISTSFASHVKWNGKDPLPPDDRNTIARLVDDAHAKGKKFRFWATPDFPEAWKALMELNMDVIVTDRVAELAEFFDAGK
jgi:alkaline phosphatase